MAVLLTCPVALWDLACMVAAAHTWEEVPVEESPLNQLQVVDSEQEQQTQVVASAVLRPSVVVLEVLVWKAQGTWLQPQTGLMWAKVVVVIRQLRPTTTLERAQDHIPKM